jgi:hypothetical protein
LAKPDIRVKLADTELQALIDIFENESQSTRGRTAAAIILGHAGYEGAIDALIAPVEDDSNGQKVDPSILRNASVALGMIARSMIGRTSSPPNADWGRTQQTISSYGTNGCDFEPRLNCYCEANFPNAYGTLSSKAPILSRHFMMRYVANLYL